MLEVGETEPVDVDEEVGGKDGKWEEVAEILVMLDVIEEEDTCVGHKLRENDGVEEEQGGCCGEREDRASEEEERALLDRAAIRIPHSVSP